MDETDARNSDRGYWQDIMAELKVLRKDGKLMAVGRAVTA